MRGLGPRTHLFGKNIRVTTSISLTNDGELGQYPGARPRADPGWSWFTTRDGRVYRCPRCLTLGRKGKAPLKAVDPDDLRAPVPEAP